MSIPTSRKEFEDYCLRQLGAGVIEINMTPEQIADCIDDAITYWHTFHLDASELRFVPYGVTDEDVNNGYLTIDMPILAVVSVINMGEWDQMQGTLANPLWHMKYDVYAALGFGSKGCNSKHPKCPFGNLTNYLVNMERLRMYETIFNSAPRAMYYQHTNHLILDDSSKLKEGEVVLLEAYVTVDPDMYREAWSDIWLKRYATARIGRLWGQNMSKYEGIELPGGIKLNGNEVYQKYDEQIKALEEEIRSTFEYPPFFLMG